MATFETDLMTARTTSLANGADRSQQAAYGGRLRRIRAIYTTTTGTDEAAADIINIGYLPPGATVIPELSSVVNEVPVSGGTITLDIGTSTDPNGFAEAVNVATAGVHPFITSTTLPAQTTAPVRTTAETLVYATVGGTPDTMTASRKIVFNLVYEV